jgi:cyanophycinase
MKRRADNRNNTCPTPNGVLLIIGGAEEKTAGGNGKEKYKERHLEILDSFLKLTNTKHPLVEVITTAGSEDPEQTFLEYKECFECICKCTVNHMHHSSRLEVQTDEVRDRLNDAHAVFFAGGDQLKITSIYGGTELLSILKQRYIFDRLVVAGTSAGAMAMSTPMIYAGVGRDEMIAGNVKVTMGLEFLKDVWVDTHFVDRGRFVRMAQVIATNPSCIGIGIEENTALIVKNGIDTEVIGYGVVIIIDGTKSCGSNVINFNDENLISIQKLEVGIFSRGDKYTVQQMNQPHK